MARNTSSTPASKILRVTRRVRFRWLLPLAHALIDCVLFFAWIESSDAQLRRRTQYVPSVALQPVLLQEDGSVEWVPMYDSFPGPFLVLSAGTLPAGLASDILFPRAGLSGRQWHPAWFTANEILAFAFWYLVGRWADTSRVYMGRVMVAYVVARSLLALTRFYEVGWRIEVLFWLCFALWLLGLGVSRSVKLGLRLARTSR